MPGVFNFEGFQDKGGVGKKLDKKLGPVNDPFSGIIQALTFRNPLVNDERKFGKDGGKNKGGEIPQIIDPRQNPFPDEDWQGLSRGRTLALKDKGYGSEMPVQDEPNKNKNYPMTPFVEDNFGVNRLLPKESSFLRSFIYALMQKNLGRRV